MAKNVLRKPEGALDITANLATAAASRNPNNVLSTLPEATNFYHTWKGLFLGKFVEFVPFKWNKKQIDYAHYTHLHPYKKTSF